MVTRRALLVWGRALDGVERLLRRPEVQRLWRYVPHAFRTDHTILMRQARFVCRRCGTRHA